MTRGAKRYRIMAAVVLTLGGSLLVGAPWTAWAQDPQKHNVGVTATGAYGIRHDPIKGDHRLPGVVSVADDRLTVLDVVDIRAFTQFFVQIDFTAEDPSPQHTRDNAVIEVNGSSIKDKNGNDLFGSGFLVDEEKSGRNRVVGCAHTLMAFVPPGEDVTAVIHAKCNRGVGTVTAEKRALISKQPRRKPHSPGIGIWDIAVYRLRDDDVKVSERHEVDWKGDQITISELASVIEHERKVLVIQFSGYDWGVQHIEDQAKVELLAALNPAGGGKVSGGPLRTDQIDQKKWPALAELLKDTNWANFFAGVLYTWQVYPELTEGELVIDVSAIVPTKDLELKLTAICRGRGNIPPAEQVFKIRNKVK